MVSDTHGPTGNLRSIIKKSYKKLFLNLSKYCVGKVFMLINVVDTGMEAEDRGQGDLS